MRISDGSSDVCSSDLGALCRGQIQLQIITRPILKDDARREIFEVRLFEAGSHSAGRGAQEAVVDLLVFPGVAPFGGDDELVRQIEVDGREGRDRKSTRLNSSH